MDFRGPVSKQMWKMTFFGLKYMLGQDLGIQVAHPHQQFPGVPLLGQNFRVGEYNIQNVVSQCEMEYMSTKYSTRYSHGLSVSPINHFNQYF